MPHVLQPWLRLIVLTIVALSSSPAMAQAITAPNVRTPTVTRADLARAYLRIDRAVAEHPPTGERCAEINRVFDRATLRFFANEFVQAVAELNAMYVESLADEPTKAHLRRWGDLRVTPSPAIYPLDKEHNATIRLHRGGVDLPNAPSESKPSIRVVDASGVIVGESRIDIAPVPEVRCDIAIPIELNPLATPGVCTIVFVDGDNPPIAIGRWPIVARRLEPIRRANAESLARIAKDGKVRAQSVACCIARNRLLSDVPSPTSSAQFLADPAQLQREIAREIGELQRGNEPYIQRDGDTWRMLTVGGTQVPFRVFAPPTRDDGAKRPLIIALHGAGGDENMFMDAYGAGVIKTLATEKDFIVVSPLTYPIAGDAALLDALIDEMTTCYAIDPTRVYLIGHSLGAGAAMGLAMARPDRIAATCCIAGAGGIVPQSKNMPPMLIIAAELDALAGPNAAERGAKVAGKARANGVPIDYRIMRDWGHTLCVGPALPDAIDWLLAHSRAPPTDE